MVTQRVKTMVFFEPLFTTKKTYNSF